MYIRVPTAEFRHVGDKYADLIQEALDNLNMDCHDVQFVTPEDDPAATPVRPRRQSRSALMPDLNRGLIGTALRSFSHVTLLTRS